MKALSIKEPYAWNIIMGDKKFEYRTWLPKSVSSFLLVSAGTPSAIDFGLGLPNGYALAVVQVGKVSDKKVDGQYAWPVTVKDLVEPFPVKGRLHFYDVDDTKIKPLPELKSSLMMFRKNEGAKEADDFWNHYALPLMQIGYDQMPKKYQKIYDETSDWEAVAKAWL